MQYGPIMINSCIVDKDSLRFDGDKVVRGKFEDGKGLNDKQLRLLTDMHRVSSLV